MTPVRSLVQGLARSGLLQRTAPSCGGAQYSTLKREAGRGVGVWGACFDGGQPHEGTGEAPGLIRGLGLVLVYF